MWESLLALLASSILIPIGVLELKMKSQKLLDAQRSCYVLTPPTDLDADRMIAFLRAATGSIGRGSRLAGVPTIVFETFATSDGIVHRLLIPAMDAEYIVGQLRSLVPGIHVTPDYDRPALHWNAGLHVKMSRPMRTMRATEPNDMAASLLASVSSLADEETVLIQWIVSPAPQQRPPSKTNAPSADFDLFRALRGRTAAHPDEIDDRRRKLEEQNVLGIGKIVAYAETPSRAKTLTMRVQKSLAAMHTANNAFRLSPMDELDRLRVNDARTPSLFSSQFTLSELVGVLAWPVGQPFVAGLPRGAARHLHATSDIPTEGIRIGTSNVPGHERPIAVGVHETLSHMFVVGGTGSGKSALMGNVAAQHMARGHGVVVIDVGGSESHESLYARVLGYVPDDRVGDVINIDVRHGAHRPVAFNILDQGDPGVVADQVQQLFERLYNDSSKGVWLSQLVFHGLSTLAAVGSYAFTDIIPLVQPVTKEEIAWSDGIKLSVTDRELKQFWQKWDNMPAIERDRYAQPLMNRAWQLSSRPETRHIIGQGTSTFQMDDVILNNKILLVNLAGVPADAAKLLASLFMDALWNSAQRHTPDAPNFLFIDEAQLLKLPMKVDDMLARARKHRLGVTVATQNVEALDQDVQRGVLTNALTKVIYQVDGRDARLWSQELGRKYFSEDDLSRIAKYEAVAKIATSGSNSSAPVTIKVNPPMTPTYNERRVIALSEQTYGRPVEEVRDQIEERRTPQPTPRRERPPISSWD